MDGCPHYADVQPPDYFNACRAHVKRLTYAEIKHSEISRQPSERLGGAWHPAGNHAPNPIQLANLIQLD
jgi:hypothetical protein